MRSVASSLASGGHIEHEQKLNEQQHAAVQTHHKLSGLLKRQQLLLALCIKQSEQEASLADKVPGQVRVAT